MKVRLAKKIMKCCYGSPRYMSMILDGLDVSKELSKIKQYWEPRWALYYASKGGGYGRVDHRIVKAEKIAARYSRKLMNCLTRLAGKTPFEIGDIMSSANKIKSFWRMKYTDDHEHNPILGKAGAFVDILSRVPADTDIVLYCNSVLSDRFNANALNISLSDYKPFEHTINLKDDGTLENTLKVNFCVKWNRDKNLAEAEIFAALFRTLESIFRDYKQYDCRKLPKPEAIAKTAANNPCAFLGMLNEFQKKYKNNKETKKK